MFSRLIASLMVLGVAVQVTARQTPRVTRIDAREGLSHNTVNDIIQSRDGYLWIATYDGLNRYNGQEFEVFRFPPVPDPAGTTYSNVFDNLFEDDAGRIWFFSSGIGYLDREAGRLIMINPTPWPDHRAGLYRAVVTDDGSLWECGALEPGKCETLAPGDPVHVPDTGKSWDPVMDETGRLWWLETDSTLSRATFYIQDGDEVSSATVSGATLDASVQQAFVLSSRSEAWVAGRVPGRFDSDTGDFEPVSGWAPGRLASVVRVLSDGSILFGTEAGLMRLAGSELAEVPLPPGASPIGTWIQEVFEDREGIVWLGARSGLYRLDWDPLPFRHQGNGSPDDPAGLPVVIEMLADPGRLWVGTVGRGLVRVEANGYREYSRRSGTLCGDQVWSMARMGNDLWLLTESGLCELDEDGSYRVLRPSRDGGILTPASSGGQWFFSGMNPGPILRIASDGRELERLESGLAPWSLFDDGHYLWVGTSGIHRVGLRTGSVRETLGLLPNVVFDIRAGRDSVLWLATDSGPVRLDRSTGEVRFVETEGVLPGRVVYSVVEGQDGWLWMGTNRGLVHLNPDNGRFRVYGPEDGVGNVEFDRRSFARSPDGTFHFGGLDGVTSFDPDALQPSPFRPAVALAEVRIERAGQAPTLAPTTGGVLRVPPGAHSFTLRLDPILFSDPDRLEARYRLVDYDPDWVSGREVRYSRVGPGDYTFQAAASSVDGVEGPITSLEVRVLPRFWQTWWFRILVLGAMAGIVWAFIAVRVANRRRVEALRLRIATNLHDEVGSHLGGIAMTADMLRMNGLDDPARIERLSRISGSARQMTQRLREIVWTIDPHADRGGKLVEHLQEIAEMSLPGVSIEFNLAAFDQAQVLGMQARHQVMLIFREALHNAARHGQPTIVTISLRTERRSLEMRIFDDGAGFQPNEVQAVGHGLASMGARARSVGGTCTVRSQPGEGSEVLLRVPYGVGRQRVGRWRDRVVRTIRGSSKMSG